MTIPVGQEGSPRAWTAASGVADDDTTGVELCAVSVAATRASACGPGSDPDVAHAAAVNSAPIRSIPWFLVLMLRALEVRQVARSLRTLEEMTRYVTVCIEH